MPLENPTSTSKVSLELLILLEKGVLGANVILGALFMANGISLFALSVFLLCLVLYRLLLLRSLGNGNQLAAWWYCMVSSFFLIRFGLFILGAIGALPYIDPRDPGNIIPGSSLALLVGVLFARAVGVIRVFALELDRGWKIAVTGTVLAGSIFTAIFMWPLILILTALESFLYGFHIDLSFH